MESYPKSIIYERCHGMSAESWSSLLELSVAHPEIGDMKFPGMPDEEIQTNMIGVSGIIAIRQGSYFYNQLCSVVRDLAWYFNKNMKILDFGCGFGRLTRFFLKDTEYGIIFSPVS